MARAHGIVLWLNQSIAPDNPLRQQLMQFYGNLAALIRRNVTQPRVSEITSAREDFADLLKAANAAS